MALGVAILAKVMGVNLCPLPPRTDSISLTPDDPPAKDACLDATQVAAYNGEERSWETYLKELEYPIKVSRPPEFCAFLVLVRH